MLRLNRDPKVELIRRLPLFRDCSTAEIIEIAGLADEIDLPVNKRIMSEGATGQEFVVIVAGTADVYKQNKFVATLGKADFVGEIALLTGEPRTATVVATTPVTVLVIARHRFLALLERMPEIRAKVEAVVPQRRAA